MRLSRNCSFSFLGAMTLGWALFVQGALGQTRANIPRLPDGKPNLNGIWQALNTANWDLQTHGPAAGPPMLGVLGAVPPGMGVVDGEEIPYLPAAAAKKKQNYEKRWTEDPEVKCYLPGVPRAAYMPYPFQILQGSPTMLFAYQYAGASRIINMGKPTEAPSDSWMGWTNGRWEGDTLVLDVKGFNDSSWFDRSGNHHTDELHVVERYTLANANMIQYEATIEDPQTFSKAWKISMPLYRHTEKNAMMMEFKCVEFTEEMLYGHLRKK